jgi:hypothetical protein
LKRAAGVPVRLDILRNRMRLWRTLAQTCSRSTLYRNTWWIGWGERWARCRLSMCSLVSCKRSPHKTRDNWVSSGSGTSSSTARPAGPETTRQVGRLKAPPARLAAGLSEEDLHYCLTGAGAAEQPQALRLKPHEILPKWNFTVSPNLRSCLCFSP